MINRILAFLLFSIAVKAQLYTNQTLTINGETKYVYFSTNTFGASAEGASVFCSSKNGFLADVKTNDLLTELSKALYSANVTLPTWVNSYRETTTGCILLYPDSCIGSISIISSDKHPSCNVNHGFVCEMSLDSTTTTTTTSSSSTSSNSSTTSSTSSTTQS